jgi:inner membrane protein involved in colicin E2 resistance
MKLFSSCDAAFATMMMGLNTFALALPYATFATSTTYLHLLLILAVIFLIRWENTASTSVVLCTIIAPVKVYVLITTGQYAAAFFGVTGISCFLLDRLNVAPVHSFWHILGGLCLYYTVSGLLTNNYVPMI